jgi:DHA2 family methylenomycin A resistance protein-like MFS transporter
MVTDTSTTFDRRPLSALSVGWFMVIVDSTIINVALPGIGRDLHAPVTALQWVVDAYIVTFAGLLLSAGWLGDRIGARRAFLAGLGLFGLASVGCALAPSLSALVAARVVQGLGAAMVVPASLALVQATYESGDTRARAVTIWALVGGVAGGLGPLLGGVLTSAFGWRAMFWINIPVALGGLWLVRRFVHASITQPTAEPSPDRPPLDVAGQLAGAVALLSVTAAVVESGHLGWTSSLSITLYLVSLVAIAALVLIEVRGRHPMLSPALFAERSLTGSVGVGLFINLAYYGSLFVLALHLQRTYHFGPLATGLALMPQTVATVLGTWIGGKINRRRGRRAPMLVGLPAGIAGLVLVGLLSTSGVPYWVLVVPMGLIGLGISFSMVAATTAVVEAAPAGQAGLASGVLNAARQVGSALGVALLGALLAQGARLSLLVGAAAYAGALVCASFVGGTNPSVVKATPSPE